MPFTVFISYSHKDTPIRAALQGALKDLPGVAISYDEVDLPLAKIVSNGMEDMVRSCDMVLAILTDASLSSQYVLRELETATRVGKQVLPLVDRGSVSKVPAPHNQTKNVIWTPEQLDQALREVRTFVSAAALNSGKAAPASAAHTGPGPAPVADAPFALLAKGPLVTDMGQFEISVFTDGIEQALVLSLGRLENEKGVPCRIHSECMTSHIFLSTGCDCREQMRDSQRALAKAGRGIIILLHQEGRGNGAAAHVATLTLKERGVQQGAAYRQVGFPEDNRTYGIAAKIIRFLRIESVHLITSNVKKLAALEEFGVKVEATTYSGGRVVYLGRRTNNLVDDVREGRGRSPVPRGTGNRIFVVGDLNLDYCISSDAIAGGRVLDRPDPTVGGTAFNAARAFLGAGTLQPILFGKVGDDVAGRQIVDELESCPFTSLVGVHHQLSTGTATSLFLSQSGPYQHDRLMLQDALNANDYDLENLEQALTLAHVDKNDIVFLVGHPFVRCERKHTRSLVSALASTGAKLVLDVVPHNMDEALRLPDFLDIIGRNVHMLVGEFPTLVRLAGLAKAATQPTYEDIQMLFDTYPVNILDVRYGLGNIQQQQVWLHHPQRHVELHVNGDTGYSALPPARKRGFGDTLTADVLGRVRSSLLSLPNRP